MIINIIYYIILFIVKFYNQNYKIKTKEYISYDKKEKILTKKNIEIFTLNKKTKKQLLNTLNTIHHIFMIHKVIYYLSDDILKGYIVNNKFDNFKDNINLYIIEETFKLSKIKSILQKYNLDIINFLGNYKIINKQIPTLERYFICINIFFMEKVKNKIKYSQNYNILNRVIKNKEYNFDDIFPLQKIRFENMDICIPSDPDNILKKEYGENYKIINNINNSNSPLIYLYSKIKNIRNISLE